MTRRIKTSLPEPETADQLVQVLAQLNKAKKRPAPATRLPAADKADHFALLLRLEDSEDIPPAEREYRFGLPRQWRADFAWPQQQVLVEIDGGNRMVRYSTEQQQYVAVGRHTQDEDKEKLNEAAARGYRVLHFSPQMLTKQPDQALNLLRRALGQLPRVLA